MSDSFYNLKKEILSCRDCKKLFGFDPNPNFFGAKNSKIIQISQAPSKNVHLTSKAFNDQSGKRLREWYQISDDIFYNTKNLYITGIAHCFPGKDKNGGDIKPPVYCANKWLKKEFSMVNNKIFIVIGREAAKYLFPKKDFNELIFNDQLINGKPAYVLPHPSPLNMKWFKDNPSFLKKRLLYIRKKIYIVLDIKK